METAEEHSWRRVVALVVASALASTAVVAAPSDAWAVETTDLTASPEVVSASLSGVEAANPELILEPADASGIGVVELSGGTVSLPGDLSSGVAINGVSESLAIRLPGADEAGTPEVLADGTVVYPGEDFASSIVVTGGAVQMLTTIANEEAPTSFSYEVSLDPGQTLELVSGGAAIVNSDGTTAILIAAAWAQDANGSQVPTEYVVSGNTLTQVVAHDALEGVAYPVVADPIWFAPWVLRCLAGIGIAGPDLARILTLGTPTAIAAAFGRGAVACIFGR